MLGWLAIIVLFLSTADHWTTYLCLRSPVAGFEVSEANPIAAWLFELIGLVPALALDGVVTLVAVLFLVVTPVLPRAIKLVFLMAVAGWTGAAVLNNLEALEALGLSPLGRS